MAYTLGSLDLGTVQHEDSIKDSSLFTQAMPRSDSDKAIILDLFGVMRTITIRGVKTDTAVALKAFIVQLDAVCNGKQVTSVYHSETSGASYNVKVTTVRWSYEEGDPNRVVYEIQMVQGEKISNE